MNSTATVYSKGRVEFMVTLRAYEVLDGPRRGRFLELNRLGATPRKNPALTTRLPLLVGGHFSLLAPILGGSCYL